MAGSELPAAVAADRHGHRVVALGSSAASTERADASEMSCSLDRPPARIATRQAPGHCGTRRIGRSSCRSSSSSGRRRLEAAHDDRHLRARFHLRIRRSVLTEHEAVEPLVGGVLVLDLHLEPGRLQLATRGLLVLAPRHSARRSSSGPWRRSASPSSPWARSCSAPASGRSPCPRPGRTPRPVSRRRSRAPGVATPRSRRSSRRTSGIADRPRPARDVDPHRCVLGDLRPGRRVLRDDRALGCLEAMSWTSNSDSCR